MKVDVVIGAMWGDEGKGRVVNYLSSENDYDYIFRVNASTNASHTVKLDENSKPIITKQLPSVFYSKSKLVLGTGAILNLSEFKKEIKNRPDLDFIKYNVFVSSSITLLIEPYIDTNRNSNTSKKFGSTNQGTGVAVVSRIQRHALRLIDIKNIVNNVVSRREIVEKIKFSCEQISNNFGIKTDHYYEKILLDLIDDYVEIKEMIGDFCIDYSQLIDEIVQYPYNVLIEGCNGILLDNLHGMYPYVTSASTSINYLLNGANISPYLLNDSYIVCGAYSCCLNKRPFPTEIFNAAAEKIYDNNSEVDDAEGMKRRVGWLDLPALKKSLIGHTGCKLVINKVDVLKDFSEICVCMYYDTDSGVYKIMPDNIETLKVTPIYKVFKGWGDVSNVEHYNDFPDELKEYIDFIESETKMEVKYIGIGKETNKMIIK